MEIIMWIVITVVVGLALLRFFNKDKFNEIIEYIKHII